jgi:ABC-2 type transport system ATP-binding protein
MDENKKAVVVSNVYKSFKLPHQRHSGLKQLFLNFYKHRRGFEQQHVLDNISFEIRQGEFFGIVGRNGSGKSTLLKMLAGIYAPNKGKTEVHGSLTPFIELGVGFNPELTGRENVFLNGALLGFNRREMEAMYDDIVEFAELERFMDQKLKNYSSGMQVRLAFSIAIRARSDILLIDEVLAVGDAIFQHKCFTYFKELKRRKQTVIFVSHDSGILQEYCDNGILLEKGKIVSRGKITKIVKDYTDILNKHEAAQDEAEDRKKSKKTEEKKRRWGKGDVLVVEAHTMEADNQRPQKLFTDKDETIGIEVTYEATKQTDKPVYGITLLDAAGQRVFDSNTMWSKVPTTSLAPGERVTVEWRIPNVLNTGNYEVAPAVADEFGSIIFDWREDFLKFKVRKMLHTSTYINVDHQIEVRAGAKKSKIKE